MKIHSIFFNIDCFDILNRKSYHLCSCIFMQCDLLSNFKSYFFLYCYTGQDFQYHVDQGRWEGSRHHYILLFLILKGKTLRQAALKMVFTVVVLLFCLVQNVFCQVKTLRSQVCREIISFSFIFLYHEWMLNLGKGFLWMY